MYNFRNDYSEAAHPAVLSAIAAHNGEHVIGYGADDYCASAAQLIKNLCRCPEADVQFLIGGTQTNFTAIAAFLRPLGGGHLRPHRPRQRPTRAARWRPPATSCSRPTPPPTAS